MDAVVGAARGGIERGLGFEIGALEVLLAGLLILLTFRVYLERRGRRVPVVRLEPATGVKDDAQAVVGPGLQDRLLDMKLGPPAIVPTPSVVESVGKVLAETGVPPATALGKVLTSLVEAIIPPQGYVASWSLDLPKAGSEDVGSGTVTVREAATGNVVGATAVTGAGVGGLLDAAADAIWSIVVGRTPLRDWIPVSSRWTEAGGASYRELREIQELGDDAAATAEAIIRLEALALREPFNADVRFALGSRYTQAGEHLSAVDAYEMARNLALIGVDARYRLAAAYSFAGTWLGPKPAANPAPAVRAHRARVRALESRVLGPGGPRPWGALTKAFLTRAEEEYRRLHRDLAWHRVAWRWLTADRAGRTEVRPLLGVSRFSRRGRIRLTVRSAEFVATLQLRRLAPATPSDDVWIDTKVDEIRNGNLLANHWQVEYNVACLVSQAVGRGRSLEAADAQVVERLERLLRRSGTDLSPHLRRWIACEDPDLHRVREAGHGFRRFWADRGGKCPPTVPVRAGEQRRRVDFTCGVAAAMAAAAEQRAEAIAGWAMVDRRALADWLGLEQRAADSLLRWFDAPDASTRAKLRALIAVKPATEAIIGDERALTTRWAAQSEPMSELREAVRGRYERYVVERAGGKAGPVQQEALAATMRAGRRWRALERWLATGKAEDRDEYLAAVAVEAAPPPAEPEDDAKAD